MWRDGGLWGVRFIRLQARLPVLVPILESFFHFFQMLKFLIKE